MSISQENGQKNSLTINFSGGGGLAAWGKIKGKVSMLVEELNGGKKKNLIKTVKIVFFYLLFFFHFAPPDALVQKK